MLLRTNLTEMRMRVAEGRANKARTFCAAVMVAILLEVLLAINPAYASTFTVTSTADSGAGSLRQAITDANNNNAPTVDTINFNIPGTETGCDATSRVCTINPSSELPPITEPVIINGYTQGDSTPGDPSDDATENTLAVGNNAELKIKLNGADAANGLKIEASGSTVKGLVISNWENGVFLNTEATGNTVRGNFIGTDDTGTVTNPDGIPFNGDELGNNIGVVALGDNNTVGGTTGGARNIISGNGSGIQIGSANGGNKVQGNYIGTDAHGTEPLGNNNGVVIDGAPNNTIGGTTGGARNVISGNSIFGIRIGFTGATGNKVQGNYIGISAAGDTTLGNGNDGVNIQEDADNNTIGGTTAAVRNLISGNGGAGVEILYTLPEPPPSPPPDPATGNSILRNSIYENDALGIDLVHSNNLNEGVTLNDLGGDNDEGPNNLQNFPVITSAKTGRQATTIKGTLNSTANTTFTLQFFSSLAADDSGFGEGQKFKGQKSVTTDSSGNATFTFKTKKKVPKGQVVTATATNQATGDTSEFSKACLVPAEPCAP